MGLKERPYILFVAELIYSKICEIKKNNPSFTNKIKFKLMDICDIII